LKFRPDRHGAQSRTFKDAEATLDGDGAKENVANNLFILKSHKEEQSITVRSQSVYDICLLRLTE
jgi:hypothetical protein